MQIGSVLNFIVFSIKNLSILPIQHALTDRVKRASQHHKESAIWWYLQRGGTNGGAGGMGGSQIGFCPLHWEGMFILVHGVGN